MMIDSKKLTPAGYELVNVEGKRPICFTLKRRQRPKRCPYCGADRLHSKGRYERRVRHLDHWQRPSVWKVLTRRYECTECERSFVPELPGIRPWRRFSEAFRESLYELHQAGIDVSNLAARSQAAPATVSRC